MKIPRLVIAGTHSGVGKTTITSGLMQLLTNAGLKVQGYKVGPDYIDPSYHTIATNRFSRNLDSWMLAEEHILELMAKNSQGADISIVEGVMGFYDGFGGNSQLGSTAHMAKITNSPVILVVDSRSMARSVAALVYGYKNFDPEVNIAGIILNKVASQRHLQVLQEALAPLNIPVLGYLFRNTDIGMPERHLGLIPAKEMLGLKEHLQKIALQLEPQISVAKLVEIANSAPSFPQHEINLFTDKDKEMFKGIKIGYAYDRAFTFYYQDNLDFLAHLGAELVPVSLLEDQALPHDLAGLIIGGGFPELFLTELSNNRNMISSLKQFHSRGLPIYAECGGFMYLTEGIIDFTGNKLPLAGIIPGECIMTKKLAGMGYRQGSIATDSIIGEKGVMVKGHEFHYSKYKAKTAHAPGFIYNNGNYEGYCCGNLLASYLHIHFGSNPALWKYFLEKCVDFLDKVV